MTDATWARPRPPGARLLACAAVTALHAILLVSYLQRNDAMRAQALEETRTFVFVPFRAITRSRHDESPEVRGERQARKSRMAATLPPERPALPVAPVPAADAPVVEAAPEIDANWSARSAGNTATVRDIRAYALSMAGKADAQARQGKSIPLDAVDTPLKRMQSNIAAAADGESGTTVTTSLSGQPVTVIRRNGKARCYTTVSTSVAPSAVFDNRGSGRATEVNCPKAAQ